MGALLRTRCAQRGWPPGALGPDDSGVNRADNRVIDNLYHTFSTPGNNPVRWDQGTIPGEPGTGVYGVRLWGMGSIFYDQRLDEHSSLTQKSLKNQGKRPLGPKFSSPAAGSKGRSPESATLTVPHIPVAPDPPTGNPGQGPGLVANRMVEAVKHLQGVVAVSREASATERARRTEERV